MAKLCIFLVLFGIMLTLGEISGKLERIAYALEQKTLNAFPKITQSMLPVARTRPTPDAKNYKRGYRLAKERMINYTQEDINYFLACNRDSDPYAMGWKDALAERKPKHE